MMRIALVLIASLTVPVLAAAQERKWEIEGYGGIRVATPTSAGSLTLPAAGAALVTSNPTFPTRETSSWLFGDGAALLNGVNEDLGSTARITPLDALFSTPNASHDAIAGVRLRRRINARFSAEVSVEIAPAAESISDFEDAIEQTRSSFVLALGGLLATGPFSSIVVEATALSDPGRRRETTATFALNAHWGSWRSLAPYATFGGGLVTGTGSLPSAELQGSYRFAILGQVPVSEADRVAVTYQRGTAFVAVLGGGVRRALMEKWGVSVDARALVGPDTTRVRVDAHPSSVRGVPADFIELFTNPAIQFSNDPATGRRSTLSGPALENFEVFSGGVRSKILVTVGLSRRF